MRARVGCGTYCWRGRQLVWCTLNCVFPVVSVCITHARTYVVYSALANAFYDLFSSRTMLWQRVCVLWAGQGFHTACAVMT